MKSSFICEKITYSIIIVLPFAIVFGLGLANALVIIMAVSFFAAKMLKKEKLLINTPVNLFYAIFLFSILLSLKNTLYMKESMKGLQRWFVEYPLLFLVVSQGVKDIKHIKFIIISVAVSVSVVSLDAAWQLFTGRDFIWGNIIQSSPIGLARPTASFNGTNLLGIYLGMLTPVIAGIALFYKEGKSRIFIFLSFLLGVAGTMLTLSRGSGLGLWAALLLLALINKKKVLIAILVGLLFIYPFIMPKNIKDWAREIRYNPVVFLFNYDRLSMYKNAINMIEHHPVIGVGINTFSKNYVKYKLPEPEYAKTTTGDTYAHNIYLHTAGETGLIGLGALLLFFFSLFKYGFSVYSKLQDKYLKTLSISILAGFVAFLINGLTETSLYYPTVVITFWFIVGFLLSLRRFT